MKKLAIISATAENWQKFESTYEADLLFDKLKNQISLFAKNTNEPWLVTSMNIGVETMAAQIALAVKEQTGLKLECVIPFEEQAKYFSEPQRDRYFGIIENCDKETLITTTKTKNSRALAVEYMVKQADIIIVGHPQSPEIEEIIENAQKPVVRLFVSA